MWKKILWVQCILVLHSPLPVTVGNRTDIWCINLKALWCVWIHGTYILFRKSKFNVMKTFYVILMFIFTLGIILILYKHTFFVFYLPRNVCWVRLFIWLLLITCLKDSTWVIRQNSSTSIQGNHFLKLLQSKALTGTLVKEFVFLWSHRHGQCFLWGRVLGANRSVLPSAVSLVATSWWQLLGTLHLCVIFFVPPFILTEIGRMLN